MGAPADTYLDLFAAYTVLWLAIVFFCVRLQANYKTIARQMDSLERESQIS